MENGGYLFAGFAAVWGVTFAYILYQQTKLKKLQSEVEELRKAVKPNKNN